MKRILISGAGIAGLALAASLEKYDLEVHLIEKYPSITPAGAAICLPANATACLKRLGILNKVIAKAFVVKNWQVFTDRGESLCDIFANKFMQSTPFISVERTLLHKELACLCSKTRFKFDASIKSMKLSGNEIKVIFEDAQEATYDLVIGADGIRSKVRSLVVPHIKVEAFEATCWRTILKKPPFLDQPQFFMGKDRFLLLHPIDDNRAYCGAITKNSRCYDSSPIENFKSAYEGICSPIFRYLFSSSLKSTSILEKKVESVSEFSWGKGRAILIGDAAHACAPSMQQGGSQALEDAIILADLIGRQSGDLINEFKAARSERVEFVFNKSNQATKKMIDVSSDDVEKRNCLIKQYGLENFNLWEKLFLSNPVV